MDTFTIDGKQGAQYQFYFEQIDVEETRVYIGGTLIGSIWPAYNVVKYGWHGETVEGTKIGGPSYKDAAVELFSAWINDDPDTRP